MIHMPEIKAITFDLWETLIHDKSTILHNNTNKYTDSKIGESYRKQLQEKNISKEQFLNDFKKNAGYKEMKHAKALVRKQIQNYKAFSDVDSILPLMKKYKLGIISNCSFVTNEILNTWGYKKIFDSIVTSYQTEAKKPAREIFDLSAKKLNLKLENILHIGNNYNEDYFIPKQHGINTLLLDRKNKHKEVAERITTLNQLERYLTKLEKKD